MSVYFPYFAYPNRAVNNGNTMLALSLLAADPEPVMSGLPGAIAEVLPSAPVTEVKRASALVQESIGRRVALSEVLGALALVALALAAIGLAGVASYSVAQRMRELAIRRMLGATERRIRLMVLAETGQLVGAGLVLGAGAAWLSRRFIASFLHGIAPFDPVTYGALAIGASAVAGLAAWVASRPISASTPARTLARD